MSTPEAIDEISQLQIECSLKAAQMNLARAEERLALNKVAGVSAYYLGEPA
jgi:hypothetical protein